MKVKRAELSMETVIVVVILIIVLFVILSITIPRINKIKSIDRCPSGLGKCVSQYGGECTSGQILDGYDCASKDQICCALSREERNKIADGESILDECSYDSEDINRGNCLCNDKNTESYDHELIADGKFFGSFGQAMKDCTGKNPESKSVQTKYCVAIDRPGVYESFFKPYMNDFTVNEKVLSFYCFEYNPFTKCKMEEIISDETCQCEFSGSNIVDCGQEKMCTYEFGCISKCNGGKGPCYCPVDGRIVDQDVQSDC